MVKLVQQQTLFAMADGQPKQAPSPVVSVLANGNVLVSRTMMLAELTTLLAELPADATVADYDHAIKADNVLRKASAMNRAKTAQLLRNLYGLDVTFPVFRALRRLWLAEPQAAPMLALLQTYAREPYLRATWPVLRDLPVGQRIATESLQPPIQAAAGGKLSSASLRSTAQNVAASWSAAGCMSGVIVRTRMRPASSPAAVAFALFLGYLEGRRGLRLYQTTWTELLQVGADELRSLAAAASQQGFLQVLQAGDVVEVRFPGWLTAQEEALLAEQT